MVERLGSRLTYGWLRTHAADSLLAHVLFISNQNRDHDSKPISGAQPLLLVLLQDCDRHCFLPSSAVLDLRPCHLLHSSASENVSGSQRCVVIDSWLQEPRISKTTGRSLDRLLPQRSRGTYRRRILSVNRPWKALWRFRRWCPTGSCVSCPRHRSSSKWARKQLSTPASVPRLKVQTCRSQTTKSASNWVTRGSLLHVVSIPLVTDGHAPPLGLHSRC